MKEITFAPLNKVFGLSCNRYSKFVEWKDNFDVKLGKLTSGYIEADEALQQLDLELLKHVVIKEQEIKWLLKYGADLLAAEQDNLEQQDPDKLAESKSKELANKMTNIEDYWKKVKDLTDTKTKKLKSIISVSFLLNSSFLIFSR